MNVQMRIVTEDNVDQLLSLTEGDDILKLTGHANIEELQKTINYKDLEKQGSIIEEKDAIVNPFFIPPKSDIFETITSPNPFWKPKPFIFGESEPPPSANPWAPPGTQQVGKDLHRFRSNLPGREVMMIGGPYENQKAEVIDFEEGTQEYLLHVGTEEEGEFFYDKGDNMQTPPSTPTSESSSPGPSPGSPLPEISPDGSQSSGPSYNPPSPSPSPEAVDHPPSEKESEPEINLPEVPEDEGEDIMKKITTINKQDTKGLEKLSAIEDKEEGEKEEGKEEAESTDIKKITP